MLRKCHNSNSNRQGSHVCKNDCCVIYPLRNDGDICDIVCIVVASIVYLAPWFWEYILTTKCLDRKGNPCQYLQEPTAFHRYLRTVVIIWISNENINIEMIINNRWILDDINESISSSDQENDENEKVSGKGQLVSKETIKKETLEIDKNNFKCLECGEIFSRKRNLKRRFDRKHKGVKLNNPWNGKCVCLQCRERFHKITDMRKHLSEDHKFVFIYETKVHSADAGL